MHQSTLRPPTLISIQIVSYTGDIYTHKIKTVVCTQRNKLIQQMQECTLRAQTPNYQMYFLAFNLSTMT